MNSFTIFIQLRGDVVRLCVKRRGGMQFIDKTNKHCKIISSSSIIPPSHHHHLLILLFFSNWSLSKHLKFYQRAPMPTHLSCWTFQTIFVQVYQSIRPLRVNVLSNFKYGDVGSTTDQTRSLLHYMVFILIRMSN